MPFKKFSKQTVLSFFKPEIVTEDVSFFDGNNSILKYLHLLKKILKEQKIDIVHAHTPHVGFLFLIYSIFFRKDLPKKLFSIHYSYKHIKFRNKIAIIPIFLFFDKIIFCSNSSKKSFPNWILYFCRKKSDIIYNGVDINLINKKKTKPDDKIFSLITVSRLDKNKNLDVVINAICQLKNQQIKLRVVGDGPEINHLKTLSSNLCLESQVTFYGQVKREKVYELLKKSQLFVSMSKTEGHPVAVLEALGAGKPVLLSDIGPHIEIAKDPNCVNISGVDGLVKLIDHYRSKSNNELLGISKLSKNLIKKYFSIDKMTNNYLHAYKSLL